MLEIGVENFYIEKIEECSDEKLDEKEKYWIQHYDSCNNGYNSTCGGRQFVKQKEDPLWLDNMILDYKNGLSYRNLSEKYNVSIRYINELLGDNIDKNRQTNITHGAQPIEIYMYDLNFESYYKFKSIKNAIKWISENTEYKINSFNGYTYISKAANNGNVAYGHRWQYAKDVEYNNKIFRSKFDLKIYKNNKTMAYDYKNKYYICDGAIDFLITQKYFCSECGVEVTKYSKMCSKCYSEIQSKKSLKPKKDVLIDLVSKCSFEEIGRQYGVTGKTIRKWCDSYNIKEHQEYNNNGTFCKTLNIKFKTFVEAAKYLIDNGYSKANNLRSLASHISEAKKSGKPINGLIFI